MVKILLFVLSLFAISTNAQELVEVSFDKTTLLVFSGTVKRFNCGAKEYVGVNKIENKIVLQAMEENFDETNLLVELEGGDFFAFVLRYNNNPKTFIYKVAESKSLIITTNENEKPIEKKSTTDLEKSASVEKRASEVKKEFEGSGKKDLEVIDQNSKKIAQTADYIKRIGIIDKKMILYVGGIWVLDDRLYFKVNIRNESSIKYDIDFTHFIVKRVKDSFNRSSGSADQMSPIYVFNQEQSSVLEKSTNTFVFVFPKFTIADNKKLFIEFWEKKGDRSISLSIESNEILNAKNSL
jgi:conjugative transposon TraN protein